MHWLYLFQIICCDDCPCKSTVLKGYILLIFCVFIWFYFSKSTVYPHVVPVLKLEKKILLEKNNAACWLVTYEWMKSFIILFWSWNFWSSIWTGGVNIPNTRGTVMVISSPLGTWPCRISHNTCLTYSLKNQILSQVRAVSLLW